MLRFIMTAMVFLLMWHLGFAQKDNPVSWKFEAIKLDNNKVKINAFAKMQKEWVIYSQNIEGDGPIPTSFTVYDQEVRFDEEDKPIKEHDEVFDMEVVKFKAKASFSSIVEAKGNEVFGSVVFMTCDGLRCLPPKEVPFSIKL